MYRAFSQAVGTDATAEMPAAEGQSGVVERVERLRRVVEVVVGRRIAQVSVRELEPQCAGDTGRGRVGESGGELAVVGPQAPVRVVLADERLCVVDDAGLGMDVDRGAIGVLQALTGDPVPAGRMEHLQRGRSPDEVGTHGNQAVLAGEAGDQEHHPQPRLPAQRGGELVDTLRTFLGTGGRWQETADLVHVHVHVDTLRNRLERVESLTDRQLDSTLDRVDLWLAFQAASAGTAGGR